MIKRVLDLRANLLNSQVYWWVELIMYDLWQKYEKDVLRSQDEVGFTADDPDWNIFCWVFLLHGSEANFEP